MLNTKMLYSYNDVMIKPAVISQVSSRKECNPYITIEGKEFLPIFTAPMSTVVNEKNYHLWEENHIMPIMPRNINLAIRSNYARSGNWAAFSLNEFYERFCNPYGPNNSTIVWKALIDVANGHMKLMYDYVKKAKEIHGDKIQIMVGNIANPETYKKCYEAGVDYVRAGIGGGSGCFVDGTKITTKDGYKNIENVEVGEMILTHDGTYQQVLNKLRYKDSNTKLCINDEITCTKEHKFFVVNKKDKDNVNESNLNNYGFWVEAQNLDKEKHLLIKRIEKETDV